MSRSTTLTLLAALLAGLLGLAGGLWLEHGRKPSPPSPAPEQVSVAAPMVAIGDPMPALTLPDPDGQPLKLPGRFAGRPLLINVWASWCGPCLQEMPELDRYSREQGDNGVQVIGLALDTPEAVRAFLRQLPVHYPIVLDLPGADDASVRLGNVRGALPYTVLIDANGRIAKQKLGPFQPGEIDGWTR